MRVLERLARETGREYALRVLKENIVGTGSSARFYAQ